MALILLSKMSAFGQNTKPSDGALLYIFEAGTTTPKPTFSDEAETTPQTHPIVADSTGVFAPVYLSGFYKEVLKDKNGVQISSVDDLQARAGDVAYLGGFDSSTNSGDYPASGNLGDEYKVSTGFVLNAASGSHYLATGDFIISNKNSATAINADWDIKRGVAANVLIQRVSTSYSAVATGTTVMPYDDTIPQITEGDEYMTVTITPKSATNKLVIKANAFTGSSVGGAQTMALFQDTTADALSATSDFFGAAAYQMAFEYEMISGTTSATTFKIRMGGTAGTLTFNGQVGARKFGAINKSIISVEEIKV